MTHVANLKAAGLPEDYVHNPDIGKQHPTATLLRHCLSDNLWNLIRTLKSKQIDTDSCPFCNQAKGTTRHIIWNCPAFAEARHADPRLIQKIPDSDVLPDCLASHGWAPALHGDPTQTVWGDSLNSRTSPKPLVGVCGVMSQHQIEHGYYGTRRYPVKHPEVSAMARSNELPSISAERFMFQQMGVPFDDYFDEIQPIEGTAVRKVNTYTDGSVRYPAHLFAAMGAFAVYHREPHINQTEMTSDERLATKTCIEVNDALHLHGPLQGAFTSSNRAEAAALLLALVRPIPLSIGVDNAQAVNLANRIIHGLHFRFRKRWELQPNGDICANIEKD